MNKQRSHGMVISLTYYLGETARGVRLSAYTTDSPAAFRGHDALHRAYGYTA
jgi:hypothetical protein